MSLITAKKPKLTKDPPSEIKIKSATKVSTPDLQTTINLLIFSKKLINKEREKQMFIKQRMLKARFQGSMSEYTFKFPETEDSARYKSFLDFWEVNLENMENMMQVIGKCLHLV